MDQFNVSFEWQGSSAVQVLDFNEMDYENLSDPSFLELQNAALEEILDNVESLVENTDDTCNQFEIPDDLSSIPSYGSFVKNLTCSESDSFENVTNSTRIEEVNAHEMSANIEYKCAFNCTCSSCLPMYGVIESEEPINLTMLEDITDNNFSYGDLTYMLNQTECTAYMELPQFMPVSNDNVKLRLRNKILAKSNAEANATTGACFCNIVSNS